MKTHVRMPVVRGNRRAIPATDRGIDMEKDLETNENGEIIAVEEQRLSRREFFAGLGKWSLVVIGAALGAGELLVSEQEAEAYGGAWANRGGGGRGAWANRGGGGGAAWANRGGGGAGAWANRAGGGAAWANRGGGMWANHGTAWANHGSAWVNRW
jgi:hypothetical protein